jgi:hypothetical protein
MSEPVSTRSGQGSTNFAGTPLGVLLLHVFGFGGGVA